MRKAKRTIDTILKRCKNDSEREFLQLYARIVVDIIIREENLDDRPPFIAPPSRSSTLKRPREKKKKN